MRIVDGNGRQSRTNWEWTVNAKDRCALHRRSAQFENSTEGSETVKTSDDTVQAYIGHIRTAKDDDENVV